MYGRDEKLGPAGAVLTISQTIPKIKHDLMRIRIMKINN